MANKRHADRLLCLSSWNVLEFRLLYFNNRRSQTIRFFRRLSRAWRSLFVFVVLRVLEFGQVVSLCREPEAEMSNAYGGKVDPYEPQASVPARVGSDQRKIRVLNPSNSRIVVCLVNDRGPWNTKDPYWKTPTRPRAEAQFAMKRKADNGEVPCNPAGLDLTPTVYDALSIPGTVNTRSAKLDREFV